jgi:hypothetical protein
MSLLRLIGLRLPHRLAVIVATIALDFDNKDRGLGVIVVGLPV